MSRTISMNRGRAVGVLPPCLVAGKLAEPTVSRPPLWPSARACRFALLLGALALGLLCLGSWASAAEPPAKSQVDIRAEDADFDLQNRTAVYRGNVVATDLKMRLSCQLLTAQWSESNRITSIVAERQVELEVTDDQGTTRATGAKAVYTAETDLVELTGNPILISRLGTLAADRVVLERGKGKLTAKGNVRMLMPAEALKEAGLTTDKEAAPGAKTPQPPPAGTPTPR